MKKFVSLIVIATTICGLSTVHASVDKNSYRLLGDAMSGSKLPIVDATSPVPFNVRYYDLTDTQKQIVRSKYDNLGVNDTPPFPTFGLKSVYKPVINANKSLGKSGVLTLTAVVSKDGYVSEIIVHKTPSKALSNKAIRTLRSVKFDAATCDGEPCEMAFPLAIKFL